MTGLFEHESDAAPIDILVAGHGEPIGCTANHPFWSEDRHAFIPAGELRVGETLRVLSTSGEGVAKLASIVPRGPPETVYNLEIHGEHVYRVGAMGALVHNSYPRNIPGTQGTVTGGNSTSLGRNMMKEYGLPQNQKWPGHQAQHIIPGELAEHPVLQKLGIDLDHASNGIFLRIPDESVSTMARHRGYHSIYNQVVQGQLDLLDVASDVRILDQQVFDLQSRLRNLTMQGTPLYPSQGATVELWERLLTR